MKTDNSEHSNSEYNNSEQDNRPALTRLIDWIWSRGIVSTFLSGLFAILPIVITVAIVTWVVGTLHSILGPETAIGRSLRSVGMRFVTDELTATFIGWGIVLIGVWLLGVLVKTKTQNRFRDMFNNLMEKIPVVKGVYGTAGQVVGMLNRDDQSELKGMSVVFCSFGEQQGAGFLAMMATNDVYRFQDRDCRVVYIPTSPIPMSGGILFVPVEAVTRVNMSADSLMQIYFSLGVLTSTVVPDQHRILAKSQTASPIEKTIEPPPKSD